MTARRALVVASAMLAVAFVPAGANAAGRVDARMNEAAKWPKREIVLSLPAKRVLDNNQVTVLENDAPVHAKRVTSEATNRKRGVVLAIDASLTMRGEPIRQAMVAARSFARRRSQTTPVGVIFFSRDPRVALKPTADPRAIKTTLAVGPALTRGTKIYDAAAAGITALRDAGLTSGAIVVLSDGAEAVNGSAIQPAALASLARRSNVRIFSVGLNSRSFNAASLRSMAANSGGSYVEAAHPQDLPPLFAAIGERLSSEYLVSYRSVVPAGAPVSVVASVDGSAGASAFNYTAPKLALTPAAAGRPNDSAALDASHVALLAGLLALVLGFVCYMLLRPKQRSLTSRITDFTGTTTAASPTLADVQERRPERRPSDRWVRYEEAVELAGIPITPTALALWTAVGTLAFAFYLGFVADRPVLVIVAFFVPLAVRIWVVSRMKARRRAFEEQLPDNLQVLASGLRAGYSFSAALASVAEDAPEPSRAELRRASTDEQLGIDVSDALQTVGKRMDSPEVEYVGIVARMQRESGGNTAEVLDQVIETIRARHQLKRMVRALTTQGRMGGAIISVMPVIVAVGMSILHPGYFDPMFQSFIGIVLLIVGFIMLTAGWLIIRKIVDVEP
jgi:tight adherence protein B